MFCWYLLWIVRGPFLLQEVVIVTADEIVVPNTIITRLVVIKATTGFIVLASTQSDMMQECTQINENNLLIH